ncbi:hypothetical protein M0805_009672 [Coniferiporia weirii]|nr:hypothetical protein M0805_009672 [Coniferiporia weirii]
MKANYSPSPAAANRATPPAVYDAFSILASSRSSSQSHLSTNPPRPAVGQSPVPANLGSGDAFSSLLGPSFAPTDKSGNLSLAERQAAALKEQQAKATRHSAAKENEFAVWSGLDMIGQNSSPQPVNGASPKPAALVSDDDWLFDKIASPSASTSKAAPTPSVAHTEDDWGLSDFASQPQSSTRPQQGSSSTSLFDALGDSPHDRDMIFDSLGERRNQPPVNNLGDDAEDDILGMLGKPVESVPKRTTPPQTTSSAAAKVHPSSRTRAGSPPPHVIGQIVEMGFSPQQARLALAATDTGMDVQQALEMLLSNGVGASDQHDSPTNSPRSRGLSEFQDEDEEAWEARRTASRGQRPVQNQTLDVPTSSSRAQTESPSLVSAEIQERADKLLAQASEIGLTMFSRANAFFKDGREKVQKVYEERAAKAKPTDGRPRWMSEAPVDRDDHAQGSGTQRGGVSEGGFRDDDDNAGPAPRARPRKAEAGPSRSEQERPNVQAPAVRTSNLLDEGPAVYVSPARRRPAPTRSTSQTVSPLASANSPAPRQPPPSSTPVLQIRQTVSASSPAIAASNAHKAKGTEMFKLGQYAEAEKAYSAALTSLPENHLLVIPLYNNRALTRIKTGDHSGAVEDCTTVLSIIGLGYHPAREAKVSREEEGASVDLADALLKAYRRRAEAYEGREKWELARKDWESIVGCDWSTRIRSDALSGVSRCRKMTSAERAPAPRKKQPPPRAATTTQDFEAVQKLRRENQALEEEEQAKARFKDVVDAKLNTWRGGKETNVRALLASLDTVLWPGLGWQKVGMHELVTPSQVKIRYMKAIAKLHPDKLNTTNTTVEQRMIANGIFASLNDAWIAFKQ